MIGLRPAVLSYAAKPCPAAPGYILELPFINAEIPAGFPSPAEHYLVEPLDISGFLVRRPKATYFMPAVGDSMVEAGINNGDLLVIDRAEDVKNGSIVVARIGDEFTVKRFCLIDGLPFLCSENEKYKPIEITEETDFEIWGCVTFAITSLR